MPCLSGEWGQRISRGPSQPQLLCNADAQGCLQRFLERINEAEPLSLIGKHWHRRKLCGCRYRKGQSFLTRDSFWWLWNGNTEKGSSVHYQIMLQCLSSVCGSSNTVEQRGVSGTALYLWFCVLLHFVSVFAGSYGVTKSCFSWKLFGCDLTAFIWADSSSPKEYKCWVLTLNWSKAGIFDKPWVPSICSLLIHFY